MIIIEPSKHIGNKYPELESYKQDNLLHIRPAHQDDAAAFTDLVNELLQTYSASVQLRKRSQKYKGQKNQTQLKKVDYIMPYLLDIKSQKFTTCPGPDSFFGGFFISTRLCKKLFAHLEKFGIEGNSYSGTDSTVNPIVEQTDNGMLPLSQVKNMKCRI